MYKLYFPAKYDILKRFKCTKQLVLEIQDLKVEKNEFPSVHILASKLKWLSLLCTCQNDTHLMNDTGKPEAVD